MPGIDNTDPSVRSNDAMVIAETAQEFENADLDQSTTKSDALNQFNKMTHFMETSELLSIEQNPNSYFEN